MLSSRSTTNGRKVPSSALRCDAVHPALLLRHSMRQATPWQCIFGAMHWCSKGLGGGLLHVAGHDRAQADRPPPERALG